MRREYGLLCIGAALTLAGCSGGGGGAPPVSSTPTPTPAPNPTPTPTPIPSSAFDTAEYRRSNGASSGAGAIGAYEAGATGRGVTVAVIDSGVDTTNAEFAARISPLSRDLAGNRAMGDDDGHGTEVAAILMAARNGIGMHGVAFDATLLALKTDRPGSCGASDGCGYTTTAIAAGFDAAVAARAKVVNVSLGGGGGGAPQSLLEAVDRAGSAGAVVVVAAGNDSAPAPDAFSTSFQAAAPASVIIAGAVDANGGIADFSNRAGPAAASYLVALGVEVRSFDNANNAKLYSGTSEAAPIISGAAALLAQGFPNLTGRQIVDLLLRTADDLGAVGTDGVYGRGRLNIARAFAPVGALSVASVADPLMAAAGALGAPLGDAGAMGTALSSVLAHDSYDRAYRVDVAAGLVRAAPGRLAASLLGGDARAVTGRVGDMMLRFDTVGTSAAAYPVEPWRAMGVTPPPRVVAGLAVMPLDPVRTAVLGFGQSPALLADLVAGAPRLPATFVAHNAIIGWDIAGAAFAQRFGGWTASLTIGSSMLAADAGALRAAATRAILRLDGDLGALHLALSGEQLEERGALFGTRLSPAFGLIGATTRTAGLRLTLPVVGWQVSAEARRGSTRADLAPAGLIRRIDGLASTGASFSLSRAGLLGPDDSFSLTIAQPLRASGTAALALGGDAPARAGLAPSGREIAGEIGYGHPVGSGWLSLGLFWREQPGHIAAAAPDAGGALRFRWGL